MPARTVVDTITDKVGERQKIRKEISGGVPTTVYEYSSGHEVIVEKSGEGNKRGLKEIREVRRVNSPKVRVSVPYRDQDHFDRIYKRGRYAEVSDG